MTAASGHYEWALILGIVALLAFVLYRRGKRLIGHQRFNERRTMVRVVILGVLVIFVLTTYVHRPDPLLGYGSAAVGFALGVIIALLALRFTQMGRDDEGVWYVPNLYLGLGLIALLVGRFVYEYFVVFPRIQKQMQVATAQAGAHPSTPATMHMTFASQPALHAVLFIVLGYYLVYYIGIVLRARHMEHDTPAGA